jgi:hypothetical protein
VEAVGDMAYTDRLRRRLDALDDHRRETLRQEAAIIGDASNALAYWEIARFRHPVLTEAPFSPFEYDQVVHRHRLDRTFVLMRERAIAVFYHRCDLGERLGCSVGEVRTIIGQEMPRDILRYSRAVFIGIYLWRLRARVGLAELAHVAATRPDHIDGVSIAVVQADVARNGALCVRGEMVARTIWYHRDGVFFPDNLDRIFIDYDQDRYAPPPYEDLAFEEDIPSDSEGAGSIVSSDGGGPPPYRVLGVLVGEGFEPPVESDFEVIEGPVTSEEAFAAAPEVEDGELLPDHQDLEAQEGRIS